MQVFSYLCNHLDYETMVQLRGSGHFLKTILFGVHGKASKDYTLSSYKLVFRFAEETNGDFDRLQPGGVFLIEMNIRLLLAWYFSCLPSKPDK